MSAPDYLAELCRIYVLAVLAFAAAAKAWTLREFEAAVAELFRIRRRPARAAARAVIALEGTIALLLLAGGGWAAAGMASAAGLFVLFGAAVAFALVQGRAVRCSCFGGRGHLMSGIDLARNAVLIGASAFWLAHGPAGQPLAASAWPLLAGVALILLVVTIHLDEIAWLAR